MCGDDVVLVESAAQQSGRRRRMCWDGGDGDERSARA